MSKLGMWKVQILSWLLLQNVNPQRQVQIDQQHFDRRQELHLWVFIAIKRGVRPTQLLLNCQNAAWAHKFFPLRGRLFSGSYCIFTEQMWFWPLVSHWGHGTHIDLRWFLFLVDRICPLMQEHFLWPLLKRKAFYCGWIRVLLFSKVPSRSE